jgi:hypothetical protein
VIFFTVCSHSTDLRFFSGNEEEIASMENGGNKIAQTIYEGKISFDEKLSPGSNQVATDSFVCKKYVQKAYFNASAAENFKNMTRGFDDKSSSYKLKSIKSDAFKSADLDSHDNQCHQNKRQILGYGEENKEVRPLASGAARRRMVRRASTGVDCRPNVMVVKHATSNRSSESVEAKPDFGFGDSFGCNNSTDLRWWTESTDLTPIDDGGFFVVSTATNSTSAPSQDLQRNSPQRRASSLERTVVDSGKRYPAQGRGLSRRRGSIGGDVTVRTPTRKQGDRLDSSVHEVPGMSAGIVSRRGSSNSASRMPPRRSSDPELSEGQHRQRRRSMRVSDEIPRRRSDSSITRVCRRARGSIDTSNAKWTSVAESDFQGRPKRETSLGRDFIRDSVERALDTSSHSTESGFHRRRSSSKHSFPNRCRNRSLDSSSESVDGHRQRRRSLSVASLSSRSNDTALDTSLHSNGSESRTRRCPRRQSSAGSFNTQPSNSSRPAASSSRGSRSIRSNGSKTVEGHRRKLSNSSLTDSLDQLPSSSKHGGSSIETDATVASGSSTDSSIGRKSSLTILYAAG